MTHKGWCVVKHQTNKQSKYTVSYIVQFDIEAPATFVYFAVYSMTR